MIRYEITLTAADVDTIEADRTVSVTVKPGLIFELTSENGWKAPSTAPGVYRLGLDDRNLARLRWGQTTTVLPVGFDGTLLLTLDTAAVTR